jgi:hypothetical protein
MGNDTSVSGDHSRNGCRTGAAERQLGKLERRALVGATIEGGRRCGHKEEDGGTDRKERDDELGKEKEKFRPSPRRPNALAEGGKEKKKETCWSGGKI